MKKRILSYIVATLMCLSLLSCGSKEPKIPENVQVVQREVDKALESTATYSDLKEAQALYNDLLKEEQSLVRQYDLIEKKLALTEYEVAAIFSIQELKQYLKNPSSLKLISLSVTKNSLDEYFVKIDYSATNDFGGNVDDTFYTSTDLPTYDSTQKTWSCKFTNMYIIERRYALYGSGSMDKLQKDAKDDYDSKASNAIYLDIEKITDNINLSITKIPSEYE